MNQAGWRDCSLDEVAADITVGFVGPMATEYRATGIPFLRSQDVEPFRILTDNVKYISIGFHNRLKKSALRPGDVVIVRTGRPGAAAVIPRTLPTANCSDLVVIRPGPSVDPRFLAYFINSAAKHHVAAHLVGAVQQHFNVGSARVLRLALPPLAEQRGISHVLDALDRKIDLNHRVNETLGGLIQALWQTAQESSPCISTSVSALAEYVNGGAYTKGADGKGRPVIRIRELNGGVSEATPRSSIQPPPAQVVTDGDLLFSWSGSLDVYRWHGEAAIVNQHIFKVLPKPGYPQWLVHEALREVMPYFQGVARDKATTMGHIQRAHLDGARISIPAQDIDFLDAQVAPMYELMAVTTRESQTLAALRNALLPELISGRIHVNEADEAVAAV